MTIRRLMMATLAITFVVATFTSSQAEEKKTKLKGLLITGGCCHDYPNQIKIITQGMSQRVSIDWDVELAETDRATKVPVYKNHDWIKPYDVVVHNECYGGVTDVDFVESIVKAHTETGVAALFIHCSMHSYRNAKTDEWRKLVGVTSMSHESHRAVDVINLKMDNPIMSGFPAHWETPNGELYKIEKAWPNMTPLAKTYGVDTKKDHTVIWTNSYGKSKVFGTTLGHHNETMNSSQWLDVVARGLLWTVDGLAKNGSAKKGFAGTGVEPISLETDNPDAKKKPTPAKKK
ncbi:MAG: heme-binding protein [Blastopirellula sp.]|nr:MAG: heme-binding protein [Blastopirellula sp.]